MPFTVKDFQGLLRLLQRQPGWRDALRAALLGEEFAELPRLVHELVRAQRATNRQIRALVQAQARTEERVGRLEERTDRLETAVERLAAAQARTEEELRALVHEVAGIKQDVGGLKQDVAGLKQDVGGLKQDVAGLKQDVAGLKEDVGGLKGRDLERTYRERAAQYFQGILRRIRVLDHQQLADLLDDAVDAGRITPEEKDQVLQTDLALVGRHHGEKAYLVAEVSSVVDREDVERARNRASILERAVATPTVAAAAGHQATTGAREAAGASGVWLVLDGRAEEAI